MEIGFATGYALEILSNSVGTAGQVVGIDPSPELARVVAQLRLRYAVYGDNTKVTIGDACSTVLPRQLF